MVTAWIGRWTRCGLSRPAAGEARARGRGGLRRRVRPHSAGTARHVALLGRARVLAVRPPDAQRPGAVPRLLRRVPTARAALDPRGPERARVQAPARRLRNRDRGAARARLPLYRGGCGL